MRKSISRLGGILLGALLALSCASAPRQWSPEIPPPLAEHLILVSIDALGEADRATMESLPFFSGLMREGSYSFAVQSVFPSLTNVAHSSIQTGVSPAVHGVGQNQLWNPASPWPPGPRYGYRRQLAVDTVFDGARRAGLSTAAVLFPLTGGARITWNFPEVVSPKGGSSSIISSVLAGNPFYLLGLELRFGKMHRGTSQPYFDDFIAASAAWTFTSKRPRLMATHWLELDMAKHALGTEAPELRAVLERMDARLGRLWEAIQASGLADRTALIVMGDHSQFDILRYVSPNALLREAGLIRSTGKGWDWDAWVQAAGGSAFLRTKNPEAEAAALAVLRKAAADPAYGIGALLDRAELDALGADRSVSWALSGLPGTEFTDNPEAPALKDAPEGGFFGGAHGHDPRLEGFHTVLFARGPGIAADRELGNLSIKDAAALVGRILGFRLTEAGALPDHVLD